MTAPAAHNKRIWPDWVPASLAAWFQSNFAAPTQTQQLAWRRAFHGGNVLVLAPTGSGKTLAAFFSILAQLGARAHRAKLPNSVLAVYVTPLANLGPDVLRSVEEPLAALNAALPPAHRIRMEVRTGTVRASRRRPHLLLTTPETLSTLLSQPLWRGGFEPETVVVDEIHSFAESKRGAALALTLERLHARAPHALQRIGLSAAAQPADAIAQLLCGKRPCAIVADSIRRMHRLEIHAPAHLPAAADGTAHLVPAVMDAVQQAQASIIFGRALPADHRLAVHEIDPPAPSAIDYTGVEQVLFLGTPRAVSRALQCLGRSSQRIAGVAFGRIVPTSLPDLLEALALRQAVLAGYIEDVAIPQVPLDVLARCLLAMAAEGPHSIDEAWQLVHSAGPYLHLARHDFDACLASSGRIVTESGTFRLAAPAPATHPITPQTMDGPKPLSARMVEEQIRLRRHLREAWSEGGRPRVESILREVYQATMQQAELAGELIERQYRAAPVPIDAPVQFEFIHGASVRILLVHCVAGRTVNRSLAWIAARRLTGGEGVTVESGDHGHLFLWSSEIDVNESALRRAYDPENFLRDLEALPGTTEIAEHRFRAVAETAQLGKKQRYQELRIREPNHPLIRETAREVFGGVLEAAAAHRHAAQIHQAEWEVFEQPRPSPFALSVLADCGHGALFATAATYDAWDS